MKIAIISDLHLGDPASVLVQRSRVRKDNKYYSDDYRIGKKYHEFKQVIYDTLGKNIDFLVLLGDILDFSIVSYFEAYAAGRRFFQEIQKDKIAKHIIYVPGNHDFDIWNIVEYEVNIINRLERGEGVRPFKKSVPGILDLRKDSIKKSAKFIDSLTLSGVTRYKKNSRKKYGGLFLDKITGNNDIDFSFVYPNLYIFTDSETLLVTHGQYLEKFWSDIGRLSLKTFGKDLKLEHSTMLNIKETVGLNFPSSILTSSGVGQAGALTDIIRKVQKDVYRKKITRPSLYLLKLLFNILILDQLKSFNLPGFLIGITLLPLIQIGAMISAFSSESTRYSSEFLKKRSVRKRCLRYIQSCLMEFGEMEKPSGRIKKPSKMIFGHTHQPIPIIPGKRSDLIIDLPGDEKIELYNTGGWLKHTADKGSGENEKDIGAEIFMYNSETDEEFRSVRINF